MISFNSNWSPACAGWWSHTGDGDGSVPSSEAILSPAQMSGFFIMSGFLSWQWGEPYLSYNV